MTDERKAARDGGNHLTSASDPAVDAGSGEPGTKAASDNLPTKEELDRQKIQAEVKAIHEQTMPGWLHFLRTKWLHLLKSKPLRFLKTKAARDGGNHPTSPSDPAVDAGGGEAGMTAVSDNLPTKDELDRQKIQVEVEAIHGQSMPRWLHIVKTVSIVLGSFVAAGLSIWQLFERIDSYQDQLGRDLEFKIDKEIITLAKQFRTGTQGEQVNAALLLSTYEKHAAPLLIASLRTSRVKELTNQIVNSLHIIAEKEGPSEFYPKILNAIRNDFDDFMEFIVDEKRKYNDQTIPNYVFAVGSLARNVKGVGTNLLEHMRDIVAKTPESHIPKGTKTQLDGLIDREIKKLTS